MIRVTMTVGQIVRDAILLQRAFTCEHEWTPLNDTEDQCRRCSIIATTAGKEHLARIAQRQLTTEATRSNMRAP